MLRAAEHGFRSLICSQIQDHASLAMATQLAQPLSPNYRASCSRILGSPRSLNHHLAEVRIPIINRLYLFGVYRVIVGRFQAIDLFDVGEEVVPLFWRKVN